MGGWCAAGLLCAAIPVWLLLRAPPAPAKQSNRMSLLYNPGPRWRAGRVLVLDSRTGRSTCGPGTNLSEANLTPLPDRSCSAGYRCAGGVSIPAAPGGVCASYSIDTRVGWHFSDWGKSPGWNANILSGGNGAPIVYRYRNDAAKAQDPCKLREVGTVYKAYQGAATKNRQIVSNPNGTSVRLGQFSHVIVSFDAAVPSADFSPPRCAKNPTAYVSADFHVAYAKPNGDIVQRQLLGVLVHGMRHTSLYGARTDKAEFWHGKMQATTAITLHGEAIAGLPMMEIPELGDGFKTVQIDYKELLKRYMTPPPGYDLNDAIITGLDVYSSVRGADMTLELKNIDVVGLK